MIEDMSSVSEQNNTFEQDELERLLFEKKERLKELSAINQTTSIFREGKSINETLYKLVLILPRAWQYPEYTVARIIYDQKEYSTSGFYETEWVLSQHFETIDNIEGSIQVFYTREFSTCDEGPFLKEERHLIDNLANMITGYLNSYKAKELFGKTRKEDKSKEDQQIPKFTGRQLLQKFLNKSNYDRDLYHDLQPFKVKEILLVANLYDAYSIEKEGRFSEYVLGDYHTLNLSSLPRITGVSSPDEIFEQLRTKHYDLIIFMMGIDKKTPIETSRQIKNEFPYIPIYVLLNSNKDIEIFETDQVEYPFINRVFVWNGESKVFFSMIKLVEDNINVENDTHIGMVRVILLVEDSIKFYSRYLPLLYNIILEQTRRIIDDVTTDDLYKVLKLRARPKILLASSYEEAIDIFNTYKDYLLCVISDVEFKKGGKINKNAGVDLIKHVKGIVKDLPIILQSSDEKYSKVAFQLQSTFIDKNSETLVQDFQSFIGHHLGFGNFIYRDKSGTQIAIAKSLKDFENHLRTIPDESLIYHGRKNHFSLWLTARGEIQAAKIINPAKVSDFESPKELREYLINIIRKFRNEQNIGKVIPFEESAVEDETNVVNLTTGPLGGKGRGCAFINNLIYNFDFQQILSNINIRVPKTSVIGADEYEYFMLRNHLFEKVANETDYQKVREFFIEGVFSDALIKKLRIILTHIKKPLAIRSSGLFEDSLNQPFAGIFETYLLPNSHPDLKVRLEQTLNAIKMVYASVFAPVARGYFEAINYKIEEEKMAVIIQEVVGHQYGDVFYPHISGVAQSYNYYPYAHMKPEDGFAILAVGLGKYVVEGEKAFRFSPAYPDLNINAPKDQIKNSQVHFYAVDLSKHDLNLLEGEDAGLTMLDIDECEKHGNLNHCASVFDIDNDRILPGLSQPGPRVVNFADILKYGYIPLSETLKTVLDVGKEAIGAPIEIEFAIDLDKDNERKASFYLLQIKPLIGSSQDFNIDTKELKKEKLLLYTEKCMGNGQIDEIYDVIFINRERFDKSMTMNMVDEITELNKYMVADKKKYILIGPGRWGTRDRWIGIPVTWPQISAAKVIVETSFEDYPLDASSGSHFFHNVTTMNVGYFSVQQGMPNNLIAWDVLENQKIIHETKYFKHVCFDKSLVVKMDGKKRISAIIYHD
jgi:CheY-like chemotaxis protein